MKNSRLLTLLITAIMCCGAVAQNPKVVNGVATFHSNIKIGVPFWVPNSWDTIVIKAGVTVTGNFVTPDERTKDLTVRGENWNTSIIKGTGKVMPYPNNVDNRRKASAISNNGTGTLFVENLTSYNPDKFHLRSEARIIVRKCRIIQDAGIPKGHADAVHGGRRSKSEVHDSYISTHDDATYSSECWLVKNTTIMMNGNGAAFQVGYGGNYVHEDPVCRVVNCTVIANGTNYSKGVVAWTKNSYKGGPNHAKLHFENFTFKTNPGKKPNVMYTMGGNSGKKVGSNCEIHVTSDNSICGYKSYEFRSNSPGKIRVFDCGMVITKSGIQYTCGSNAKPSISLTSPANGATFLDTDNITISANASDSDGSITQVEFFAGANSLGVDNQSPYSITTQLAKGTYSITAKASDNCNASKTSGAVSITVDSDVVPCTTPGDATISSTDATCGSNNGKITFNFNDDANRTAIRLSIDGGVTYTKVNDNTAGYTFNGLAEGTYNCWVTWGDGTCATELGNETISCTGGGTGPISDGVYFMKIRHSNKYVEVANGSTANGGNVRQWKKMSGTHKKWEITGVSGEWYKIVNVKSGKAMEVAGFSTVNGGNIQQWNYNGTDNQLWKFIAKGSGWYQVESKSSGKVLDIAGGVNATQNGKNIQQWKSTGKNNQQFKLQATTKSAELHKLTDISVYPNPASSVINIEIPDLSGFANVEILSLTGKVQYAEEIYTSSHTLNIQEFETGSYIIKIVNNDTVHTQVIVVK